jgi:hypothetical protein
MGNREAKLTMVLAFLTGPLLTQLMAAQYPETYKVGAAADISGIAQVCHEVLIS